MTDKSAEKKDVLTESDKMWNEIKDLPIAMFALPDQRVKNHVQRLKITPTEVHLKLDSSSVLASLDPALNMRSDSLGNTAKFQRFNIAEAEGYVIITRAAKSEKLPKPEPKE